MLYRKKELGQKALTLMNDEAFSLACEGVKDHYIKALLSTKRLDVEGRENLHKAICLIDDVKRHLGYFVEDGKIANEEIKHLKRGK